MTDEQEARIVTLLTGIRTELETMNGLFRSDMETRSARWAQVENEIPQQSDPA